jgi:hypothetical protein
MTESVSAEIKQKKATEKRTMEEIQEREAKLLDENRRIQSGENIEDDFETYITLKVKKAQLTFTYSEHKKKMEEIANILVKTRKELDVLDFENPTFTDKYFEKYQNARKTAGLEDVNVSKENFLKYMVEDINLPEIEELYQKSLEEDKAKKTQEESDEVKTEEESIVVKTEEESDLVKTQEESDLVKTEEESDVVKTEEVKTEEESDLVKTEEESDVVKTEEESDLVKTEEE